MISNRFRSLLLWTALAAATPPAMAAEARAAEPSATELEAEVPVAPVELDSSVLLRVRDVSAFPAEQRAARIKGRIEALAQDETFRPEVWRPVESDIGIKIMAGEQLVMGVYDADARIEGVKREVFAANPADLLRRRAL